MGADTDSFFDNNESENKEIERFLSESVDRFFEASEIKKDITDSEEKNIIALAQKGDIEAMEALLAKYKPLVLAVCKGKFLPGADRNDLVQEGFIGVYSAVRTFSEESGFSFAGFAATCVKRRIATALKNANRKKHAPLNFYVSLDGETDDESGNAYEEEISEAITVSENPTPEDILINREDEKLLNDRLSEVLTPLELAVMLAIIDGYSYAETAERLGITEKSVDNARQRIKLKIAKNILNEGY
jgi:RNA polymerase sporulation-specific sigma factor